MSVPAIGSVELAATWLYEALFQLQKPVEQATPSQVLLFTHFPGKDHWQTFSGSQFDGALSDPGQDIATDSETESE